MQAEWPTDNAFSGDSLALFTNLNVLI